MESQGIKINWYIVGQIGRIGCHGNKLIICYHSNGTVDGIGMQIFIICANTILYRANLVKRNAVYKMSFDYLASNLSVIEAATMRLHGYVYLHIFYKSKAIYSKFSGHVH